MVGSDGIKDHPHSRLGQCLGSLAAPIVARIIAATMVVMMKTTTDGARESKSVPGISKATGDAIVAAMAASPPYDASRACRDIPKMARAGGAASVLTWKNSAPCSGAPSRVPFGGERGRRDFLALIEGGGRGWAVVVEGQHKD